MKEIISNILLRLDQPIEYYSKGNFKFWVIDNLLPKEIANQIADSFPNEEILRQRSSLREYKKVGVDFNNYEPILEQITYSFHDNRVLGKIEQITGFNDLVADKFLYAGGLSSMSHNSFLKPHLDNSHNDEGSLYRVLNLLYYVSKDWQEAYGGNLILYPKGLKKQSITIESKFNRLVLMETNDKSYHGVSKVNHAIPRRCVSNYYYSSTPTVKNSYRHVTSFYPFPLEKNWTNVLLLLDRSIRQKMSGLSKKAINYTNWHKRS